VSHAGGGEDVVGQADAVALEEEVHRIVPTCLIPEIARLGRTDA
jgi:hypothetical protein